MAKNADFFHKANADAVEKAVEKKQTYQYDIY